MFQPLINNVDKRLIYDGTDRSILFIVIVNDCNILCVSWKTVYSGCLYNEYEKSFKKFKVFLHGSISIDLFYLL